MDVISCIFGYVLIDSFKLIYHFLDSLDQDRLQSVKSFVFQAVCMFLDFCMRLMTLMAQQDKVAQGEGSGRRWISRK